ncbi:MAG: hypothetical protein IJV82_04730 [Oscillospiraceae bacterium]|nr:hypothetical protein [Oscillospiraceae bacterium]
MNKKVLPQSGSMPVDKAVNDWGLLKTPFRRSVVSFAEKEFLVFIGVFELLRPTATERPGGARLGFPLGEA